MPPDPSSDPPAAARTSDPEALEPVVVVTGPTAGGKTALAIELARRFGGEVINADSLQVYRYLDIGSAKPSLEERATVPHHLFDVALPDEPYDAGRYAVEARAAAAGIRSRGHLPILAGGTGLYIRAFLRGLIGVGGADPELREKLEAEHARAVAEGDPGRLHRRLAEHDPRAAERIHPNDLRRQIRALEILEREGRAASVVQREHGFEDAPFAALHLAIDPGREVVNERIDRRCEAMIEAGLLQEVRALRERGYGPELKPMRAIGYRHIQPVVEGSDTLVNALAAMKKDTRHFARRQRTWLRAVPEAEWLDPREPEAVFVRVEEFLTKRS